MWSYSQWVLERTCGLWTERVKQKSQYTDRHLSLLTLHDTQLHALKHAVRLDILTDQTTPNILRWLDRHINPDGVPPLEDGVSRTTYSDRDHWSSLHTPAGRLNLTCAEARALADMLESYGMDIPRELSNVLTANRTNVILSLPTSVKVPAYKHLLTNDRQAEQALFNAYVRGKRFEPPLSRDATFARINNGPNGEASFGRIDFFFTYEIPGVAEGGEARTLMLACYEPLRAFNIDKLCRIHGGDPLGPARNATRRTVVVNADMIIGLLGIVYNQEKAYFVCRDSCFL